MYMETDIIVRFKAKLFDAFQLKSDDISPQTIILNFIHALEDILPVNRVHLAFSNGKIQNNSYNNFYEILNIRHLIGDFSQYSEYVCVNSNDYFIKIEHEYFNRILYVRDQNGDLYCALLLSFTPYHGYTNEFWQQLGEVIYNYLEKTTALSKLIIDEYRNKRLSRVTETFHSTMDINDVLKEIGNVLKEIYPFFDHCLLLTTDNISDHELPIKYLNYTSDNYFAMQAYVNGEVQLENTGQSNTLYAPIKGKQGVYGVLQVTATNSIVPLKEDIDFITGLANTAGNAMENAHLYQQSRQLIDDLQLINETSKRLNSNLVFADSVSYMSKQISLSFHADEVAFFRVSDEGLSILPGFTSYFDNNDDNEIIIKLYEKLSELWEAIFIGDTKQNDDFGLLSFRSLIAIPMIHSNEFIGFVLVLHKDPYRFTFESFKLMQSLIQHWTLAFMNALLREELEKLVVTDYLTKLYARNYLDQQISESMKKDIEGTFILIDIDNFKLINDQFGHQTGDKILIQVANIIKEHIRTSDIGARWGGEELAIYLPGSTFHAGIAVSERLVEKVKAQTDPKITISCGVSHWSYCMDDTPFKLFKRADEALYKAKSLGKNRSFPQISDL